MTAGADQRVAAVVLAHNAAEMIESVLDAIRSQTRPVDRLLVVDNASSDGTADIVRSDLCEDILLAENLGVGAGHWTGWQRILEDESISRIWALEHDSVPAPSCLELLLAADREWGDGPVGAVIPRQTFPHVTPRKLLRLYASFRSRTRWERRQSLDALGTPYTVRTFSFNGTLLRVSRLRELGPLRTDFFVGLEDYEYALRMRRAGYVIVRNPNANLIHIRPERWGVQSPLRTYYSRRNEIYLQVRLEHRPGARVYALRRLLTGIIKCAAVGPNRYRRLQATVRGTIDGLTGNLGRKQYGFLRSS